MSLYDREKKGIPVKLLKVGIFTDKLKSRLEWHMRQNQTSLPSWLLAMAKCFLTENKSTV